MLKQLVCVKQSASKSEQIHENRECRNIVLTTDDTDFIWILSAIFIRADPRPELTVDIHVPFVPW